MCDVRGCWTQQKAQKDTQDLVVVTRQHVAGIHAFDGNISVEMSYAANKDVNKSRYPGESPFKSVDVQLRPLGVNVGADGEEVLRQNITERQRDEQISS